MIKHFLVSCCLFSWASAKSQTLGDKHYSRVVISHKEVRVVTTDSLQIDTLIMGDKSILKFDKDAFFTIENAFVGKECEFNSSGSAGGDATTPGGSGLNGTDGKNLSIAIRFRKLGNLTIIADGGQGGNGASGLNGSGATYGVMSENTSRNGQRGGNGGNGGNAGNITLQYVCEGFIPVFGEKRDHGIMFRFKGGSCGRRGAGGRGYGERDSNGNRWTSLKTNFQGVVGSNGSNGYDGRFGSDGKLLFFKLEE